MKTSSPTSRDIAEIAGVSQATVSRALRDSPLVRKETRDKIQKIARDMNYYVNRAAAGLRTHQSYTLALLLFDESESGEQPMNLFLLSMLDNITRAASRHGYDVLLSLQQQTDDWHIEYQASNRADGVILLGYGHYEDYRSKLETLENSDTSFIIWGPMVEGQPGLSVGCDNASGGYQASRHLLKLGRRRICFIGSRAQSPELAERYAGYVRALDEAGIEPDEALRGSAENSESQGYAACEQLIQAGVDFDAIFAATDLIAIGAMRALQDSGRGVPDDVAVVGFDDMPLAAHVTPSLTTVQQNAKQAAQALVDGIVHRINGAPVESSILDPALVVRESCGSPRA